MKHSAIKIFLSCLITICLFSLGCNTDKGFKVNDISVTAKICGKANKIKKSDSIVGDYLFLNLIITNKDSKLKSVWIYSCSWMQSWTVEPNSFYFYNEGCDSNYPKKIDLNPGQSISFHGIIVSQNNLKNFSRFRVGFADYNEIELKSSIPSPPGQQMIKLNPKMYWSDWISLDFSNNSYEISK